jgi:acyl-CoA thioesterase I
MNYSRRLRAFSVAFLMLGVAASLHASQLVANLKAGKAQVIVGYGTSLTEKSAWLSQLGTWLASQGYSGKATLVNKGMSGSDTRSHGKPHVQRDVVSQKADTVFIEFGMNDCIRRLADPAAKPPRLVDQARPIVPLEEFKTNLETIVKEIRAGLPKAELFLLIMNPATDSTRYPNSGKYRAALADYYQAIREIGKAKSVQVIDTYPLWLALQKENPEKYKACILDGVHPNAIGSQAITLPAITATLTR